MTDSNILKGMIAGFLATAVLSVIMVMKALIGVMPELDVIAMLTKMMGASSPLVGWTAHFVIGTVFWGGMFGLLDPNLPGSSHWLKGIVFGVGAWLLMMIAVIPMAGMGLFGMTLGIMAPVMTLVLHIIFGAVLGGFYGAQRPEAANEFQAKTS